MSDSQINQTTLDDFIIEKVIGKGSFGSVYLVKRKADNKLYALKSVFLEKLNKKEKENSVNEVRLLASVSHPNVIGYKEAFLDDKNNTLNIIMEYADDGDLQTKINQKRKEQKVFNEKIIWLYSIQMIEGLKALHDKKIMHRDLKSANVFLTSNKNQCKLGDMNVSKVIKEKFLTTQTGTPYYASPEVWRDEPYSYKSDLWSIGCVIYEMCALRPPFNGNDLDELFENVCKGKIKRISSHYSDELWEMILMLLQNDVEKRVDCNGFLNSEIIQNKIKELKDDPRTGYEGNQLDKNKDLPMDSNTLLETINFKNIDDLKIKLPSVKNYENNITQTNKVLVNNNSPIIKSKNNSINALITNTSIRSNINQNLTNNNNNKNNNSSLTKDKKTSKKKLGLERINIKYNNKINNIFYLKEKKNGNNKVICFEKKNKHNTIKVKSKNKNTIKKLPKNISFNGLNSSHINSITTKHEKQSKKKLVDKNVSERYLFKKKNKEYMHLDKKRFEKIIDFNKIKEFLKICKKRDSNTNRTERSKNELKKSCSNLFRNQTENNNKILNTKYDIEEIGKNQKNISIVENSNKSKVIKKINTDQKASFINKLYKMEFCKMLNKKIMKSPTAVSMTTNSNNKERAYSNGINRRSLKSINKILLKNKTNKIYYNLFNNNNNYFNRKSLLPSTPYNVTKKSTEKCTKRNLTTIPYNNDSHKNNKSIKNEKKKRRLLNDVLNTATFNNIFESNSSYNSFNNKYNYFFNLGNYYSELDKNIIKTKKKLFKNYKQGNKPRTTFTIKRKKYIGEIPNDNYSSSNKNIYINNSYSNYNSNNNNNNSKKKFQKLFSSKNYLKNQNNKSKNDCTNKSTENTNSYKKNNKINKHYSKKVSHQKKSPKINEMCNQFSVIQKSLTSSMQNGQSNSNVDMIKKRNSYTYILNQKSKKNIKNKNKNISIKKINALPFCNPHKAINNNYILYKNYFKKNKDIVYSEPLLLSNREDNNCKIKSIKNKLNVSVNSVNDNYLSCNHNTFLHNVRPIYLNLKNDINIKRKINNINKNVNKNKRVNTINSRASNKNNQLINSQIFNNYYSINNIDASSLPVKVINFYN